tara:strand:+ start:2923 stop:3645 length:723 start_codon:yes stop_codon:yes gene_type:complete
MATTNIDASKQTFARSGTQTSWSAARNATSSNLHTNYTTTQTSRFDAIMTLYSAGRGGGSYVVNRSFFFFDTSTVAGTITAIDLKIYAASNGGHSVRVAKSTAYGTSGGSAYTNSDFNNWTALNPISLSPIPYTSAGQTWSAPATNTLSLNSTAISDANSNSYLNLVLVGQLYDYPNSTPGSSLEQTSGIQFASTTTFPKLAITYTPSGYGNDVNGVASANIASVNGVATANIASINSVT